MELPRIIPRTGCIEIINLVRDTFLHVCVPTWGCRIQTDLHIP